MKKPVYVLFAAAIVLSGCSGGSEAPPASAPAARISVAALPKVDAMRVLDHIKVLSSDEFEGRAPGTPGEETHRGVSVRGVQEPRVEAGQHGRHVHPEGPARRHHGRAGEAARRSGPLSTFKWKDDVVAWTKHVADGAAIDELGGGVRAATVSSRPSTAGTTSRASTSRARRWSCWSTIRRCRIRCRSLEARSEDVQRQGDDLLRPLDLQVRGGGATRARPPSSSSTRPGRPATRIPSSRDSSARSSIS